MAEEIGSNMRPGKQFCQIGWGPNIGSTVLVCTRSSNHTKHRADRGLTWPSTSSTCNMYRTSSSKSHQVSNTYKPFQTAMTLCPAIHLIRVTMPHTLKSTPSPHENFWMQSYTSAHIYQFIASEWSLANQFVESLAGCCWFCQSHKNMQVNQGSISISLSILVNSTGNRFDFSAITHRQRHCEAVSFTAYFPKIPFAVSRSPQLSSLLATIWAARWIDAAPVKSSRNSHKMQCAWKPHKWTETH